MKKERSALSAAGTGIFTILGIVYIPVSYTHLDVYKRQQHTEK